MLSVQFAAAYVDLSLRTNQYDGGMKRVKNDLAKFPGTLAIAVSLNTAAFSKQMVAVRQELAKLRTFPIRLTVDRLRVAADLNLVRQQMQSLTSRGGARVVFNPDLRQWQRSIVSVFTDLNRVRAFASTIPIRVNATAAHANINLLMQQLRAAQTLTRFQLTAQRGPGFGLGATGGRSGMGGGFVQGLGQGFGLPFSTSPQMMAGQMLGSSLVGTVQTATHLESEFAQLERITGLTAAQMATFKSSLLGMATSRAGVSTQDLLEISQIGGRMGVADRGGVSGLTDFTEQLARVKLAVTDVPTEELANRIGRVLNVFELGTDRVAGFGSALTALDNISTASARDILDITTRLSGTAKAIGLTIPQVASLASVLKDVGLENEVAGSSFSQIFRKMATDADNFSEQIGIDAKAFADAYRRDPMDALGLVIAKFKEMTDTIAGQELLASLGLKGVRVTGALQQLASKFGEVGRRSQIASVETGSLSALGGAEAIMGDTTGSTFQRTKNSIVDLADAAGTRLTPVAKASAEALGDVASSLAAIIRGTNQVSFAAPGAPAKAKLAPLAARAQNRVLPATVDEAEAAVSQARKHAATAEQAANETSEVARQRGFEARQAMAGARSPADVNAAIAMFGGVEQAERDAGKAAEQMKAAGDALRDAMQTLNAKRQEQAEKDDEVARKARIDNAVFGAKARLGNLMAAAGEARQGLLGVGMRGLAQVLPEKPKTEQHFSAGLSGAAIGERIQEEILNMGKNKDAEETAQNTRPLAGLLSEVRDILKRGAQQGQAAILGQ